MRELFTEFERDDNAETGVMWEQFVSAVAMYVYTNEGSKIVTVADVAEAFNTLPDLVVGAFSDHPWLFSEPNDDPTKQTIESDGE